MGRLADKFAKASNAIAGVEVAAEKTVDKIIARTQEVYDKLAKVETQKLLHLDGHMNDVHEFERDIEDFAKNDRSAGGSAYIGTTPPKKT